MEHRAFNPSGEAKVRTGGLAHAIARFAQSDGDYTTAISALSLHRRNAPTNPLHCIFNLGLGVVAQGRKQALIGSTIVNYGPGQSMLAGIDLPVNSHVTHASAEVPMLGLMLALDNRAIERTAAEMQMPPPPRTPAFTSITIETLDCAMVEVLCRLVNLLDQPALASQLAPLYQQEIVVRLLAGPHGPQLRHLATNGSPSQQITRAVAWLKQNFSRDMRVNELAAQAHMSPSTFREHFRSITGTSPLQYQKQLRLQAARQIMLIQGVNAGIAAVQVGYESASQFSREYSRLFGAPPQQDVKRLRL